MKILNLHWNRISNRSAILIENMLIKNDILEIIYLFGNFADFKVKNEIISYDNMNYHIKLYLINNILLIIISVN